MATAPTVTDEIDHSSAILSQRELPSLNGIRAIAALMVVLGHSGIASSNGGTGVLIFFVLSGFLITWLLLKEYEKSGTISLRKFYSRRALRIFPAFYSYWFFYIAYLRIRHFPIDWGISISSFVYVANYYQAFMGKTNGALVHTWSLGVEEQFYLLWPAAFLIFCRNRPRMPHMLMAVILGVWVHRLLLLPWASEEYIYEAFDTRMDHLLIGCLLAVVLRSEWRPAVWRALSNRMAGSAALILLAGLSIFSHYRPAFRDSVEFIVEPILAACLIVFAMAHASDYCRFLNWNWMAYLGRISYGIYLYHMFMAGVARRIAAMFGLAPQIWLSVGVTVLAASLSYFLIERWFLMLKARYS
jgi:peptidoglycan/LPS O-acetylase OafA/YrhL